MNNDTGFMLGLITLFVFIIVGCTSSNLVTMSSATKVKLNQVSEIGNVKGEIAPDFTVLTIDNKPIVLGDFARNKRSEVKHLKKLASYFALKELRRTWCHTTVSSEVLTKEEARFERI